MLLVRVGLTRRAAALTRRVCDDDASAGATRAPTSSPSTRAEHPEGYGRGARILSIGIAATGLFTFAYFALATTSSTPTSTARSRCCGRSSSSSSACSTARSSSCSRARSPARRARGLHSGHPLRAAARAPGRLRARVPGVVAGAAPAARGPASAARRRCRGSSSAPASRTRRATSRAATSPATAGSASTAGSCCSSRVSRFCFPLAVAVGIASGQTAVALGILAAPLASLLVVPWAIGAPRAPRRAGAARPSRR